MNYRYPALVLLWMGLIFCLSSIPHLSIDGLGDIGNQISRKSIHIIVYGILMFLIWHSFPRLDKELYKKIALFGFLALAFAVSDEFHQAFVPGRCGNVKGFLFDFMGIGAVLSYLSIRTPEE